jgi:exodeoxyribonuclease-3
MRIFSWNINGFRAAVTKGLMEWLLAERPDLLCLQETRADPELLPAEQRAPENYTSHWAVAERLGYSGVATFSRIPVPAWRVGLGIPRFDREGRVVVAELDDIEIYNVYVPSGARNPDRFAYKLAFYETFLDHIDARARAGKRIIFCGDLNAVRAPIDIARPVRGVTMPGITLEERAWLDRCAAHGWVDAFRALHPETRGAYTWWSTRGLLREQNI